MALSASAYLAFRNSAGLLEGLRVNYDAAPEDLAPWVRTFPSAAALTAWLQEALREEGQEWDLLTVREGKASGTPFPDGPQIYPQETFAEVDSSFDYGCLVTPEGVEVFNAKGERVRLLPYGA